MSFPDGNPITTSPVQPPVRSLFTNGEWSSWVPQEVRDAYAARANSRAIDEPAPKPVAAPGALRQPRAPRVERPAVQPRDVPMVGRPRTRPVKAKRVPVEGRNQSGRILDVTAERIAALKKSGLAIAAIAERLGCKPVTIWKRMREANSGATRARSKFSPEVVAEVVRRKLAGERSADLSREFCISDQRIRDLVKASKRRATVATDA